MGLLTALGHVHIASIVLLYSLDPFVYVVLIDTRTHTHMHTLKHTHIHKLTNTC